MDNEKISTPSLKEAFLFWLKLGFISFGGPAGQIAIMHEYLVTQKRWISDSRFLNALNYCMLLPGPEAQQLTTYIGWLFHGIKGGLIAGILFVLPSLVILIFLSTLYATFGNVPSISALFEGLKPAVVAIVIIALLRIGSKSLRSILHYILAILSFVALYLFRIPFPFIIITAVLLALITQFIAPDYVNNKEENIKKEADETGYMINHTNSNKQGFNGSTYLLIAFTGAVLWSTPFIAFYLYSSDFTFWKSLSLFFTKAALVTFGGAYAVLPYVAQVSVEKFRWLSHYEMIDGLALGETTPGPLIMVLVFVGYMGGYHHYGNSIIHGVSASCITAFYTFLPCFLFIFIGAPLIERTHRNLKVKALLSLITAAVAGVILNLTIYFAEAVIFPEGIKNEINYMNLTWTIISFIAIYKFKVNMILWIAISALFGLLSQVIGF